MNGSGVLVMALVGIALIVWGVSQMRKGMKDLNRIADELSDSEADQDEDTFD